MSIDMQADVSVGETLKDLLEKHNITQIKLATVIGVRAKIITALCHDRKRVTTEIAIILSKVFNTEIEYWVNLQMMSDLTKIRKDPSKIAKVRKIKRLVR